MAEAKARLEAQQLQQQNDLDEEADLARRMQQWEAAEQRIQEEHAREAALQREAESRSMHAALREAKLTGKPLTREEEDILEAADLAERMSRWSSAESKAVQDHRAEQFAEERRRKLEEQKGSSSWW